MGIHTLPSARIGWALLFGLWAGCGDDDGAAPTGDGGMLGDAGQPSIDAGKDASAAARAQIPLVTPPVKAATPPSLGGTGVKTQGLELAGSLRALEANDLKSRFFTAGPTSIFQILGMLDDQIRDINTASENNGSPCLMQAPVAYVLTPFGESLTFQAQCYRAFGTSGTEPSFLQFGQKDGVTYLYIASGAQHVAARLTPAMATNTLADGGSSDAAVATGDAGASGLRYRTDVWIGVGYNNATDCGPKDGFDGCSYGVVTLHTDETRLSLELTVAGIGFGCCGAQLKSDGTKVFARASLDMGTTCLAPSALCVAASDVTTPADCTGFTTFSAAALGRKATASALRTFGASQYPGGGGNQITLDGTNTDSLRFGPTAPTASVGEFVGTPRVP